MNSLHPGFRALLFAAVLMLVGCVATPSGYSDRLFFGRAIPGGGEVSEAQWNTFVAEVIMPRFPAGFTVYRGAGHWRGDDGTEVSEASSILELVHPADAATDRKLEEIAAEYCRRFRQETVMRVRSPAELSFQRQ